MKPQNDVILKLLEIESKRSLESAKTKTKKLSASSQKSRKKIEQDEEPDNNSKNNVDKKEAMDSVKKAAMEMQRSRENE